MCAAEAAQSAKRFWMCFENTAIGFAAELDVGAEDERRRRRQLGFGLERPEEWICWRGKASGVQARPWTCWSEMSVLHPSGDGDQAVGRHESRESGRESELGYTLGGRQHAGGV